MKKLVSILLALACSAVASAQDQPQTNLQRIVLTAGFHRLEVQVAATPSQRALGLMHRQSMPDSEGMLFVFPEAGQQCFWMKNTLLPLSAAFISDDGTIVNIADMKPQSTESHCSLRPVRYVLETNQGWFAKKGLRSGSKIQGAAFK